MKTDELTDIRERIDRACRVVQALACVDLEDNPANRR